MISKYQYCKTSKISYKKITFKILITFIIKIINKIKNIILKVLLIIYKIYIFNYFNYFYNKSYKYFKYYFFVSYFRGFMIRYYTVFIIYIQKFLLGLCNTLIYQKVPKSDF